MIANWKRIALHADQTIKEAMQTLDSTGLRIILIVDEKNHLIGALTDGDIRRGLLKGIGLDATVDNIMNRNPISVSSELSREEVHVMLHHAGVLAIPIIDEKRKIVGLETIDSLDETAEIDTTVVLMAGGYGKRLMPLTEHMPKPMLPLGNKPILAHIVENLRMYGFQKFIITTHYRSEIIQEYFSKNYYSDVQIECIAEDEPLGTAGSLFLLKDKIKSDFIVMNSDLVTKINFENFLKYHKDSKALCTACVRQSVYQVPYGVVEIENSSIKFIKEKPSYTHFISAGVYCFHPEIFRYIYEKTYLDMPSLLGAIINNKIEVKAYFVHEDWVDIGHKKDYETICEVF